MIGLNRGWLDRARKGDYRPSFTQITSRIIRYNRIPLYDRNRQRLGEHRRAIVWADFMRDTSHSAISEYIGTILTRATTLWQPTAVSCRYRVFRLAEM